MNKEYLLNKKKKPSSTFFYLITKLKEKKKGHHTYPIIQAPPVIKATTGFGPLLFLGKYKSSLQNKISY